ncbi:MAG: Mth938-like domain-containing protein [Micavibrio sp.]
MDVTPLIPAGRQIIQAYVAGGFKVSGKSFAGPLIVTPVETSPWNAPELFSDLSVHDFAPLFAMAAELDVVLLGTGVRGEFFPPALRGALKGRGLIIDAMGTGAACRTYNVLMAEGRRIAAALMPV